MSDDEVSEGIYDDDNDASEEEDPQNADIDVAELADADENITDVDDDDASDVQVDTKAIFDDLEEEDEGETAEEEIVSTFVENVETENKLHKNIVVIDPAARRTSNILTEYEHTELISIRASQIEQQRIVLTDVTGLVDAEAMAEKELADKKCPLVLRRKIGEIVRDGILTEYIEYWDVNSMGT